MNVTDLRNEIHSLESREATLVAQEREHDQECDRLLAASPGKLHEAVEFTDSGRAITPASRLADCRERLTGVRERLRVLRPMLPSPADDEAHQAEVDELADRVAAACAKFDSVEDALGSALAETLRVMTAAARLRREAFELVLRLRERCSTLGLARPTAPGVPAFRARMITLASLLRPVSRYADSETHMVYPVDEQLARAVAEMLGEPERARVPEVAAP